MYERSAIVLERYFENFFGFDKNNNIKNVKKWYEKLIEEIERCQNAVQKEEEIIATFDEAASKINKIQKAQTGLYHKNIKLEEVRNQIFCEIGDNKEKTLDKLNKLEKELYENEEKIRLLKEEYVENLGIFLESQEQRMIQTKERRTIENNQLELVRKSEEEIKGIEISEIKKFKEFSISKSDDIAREVEAIMFENGKNEMIGFNQSVVKSSVGERIEIAKEEVKCYVLVLERLKRVLIELNNSQLPLIKYQKIARDISSKMNILEAKKAYIVGFLDNERVTVISGEDNHKKLMEEATKDFLVDIAQIDNLYELVLKEIANKSTKKAYDELYNKTYLEKLENTEQNFKDEINNINIHTATVINFNYWRAYGVKNVYAVFKQEVVEKFAKDLSDYEDKIPNQNDVFEEENFFDKFKNVEEVEIDEEVVEKTDYGYQFEKDEYDEVEEDYEEDDFSDLVELSDLELGEGEEEEFDEEVEDDLIEEFDEEFEDEEEDEDDDESENDKFFDVDDEEDDEDDEEDDDDEDEEIKSEELGKEEKDEAGDKKNIFNKMFGEGKRGKKEKIKDKEKPKKKEKKQKKK